MEQRRRYLTGNDESGALVNDLRLGTALIAPTLLSVRVKPVSNETASTSETTVGADDEDEDPMVTNLEQDEIESEVETQRRQRT